MKFDYSKICIELISDLKEKEKEIISRRFGIGGKNRETLESIGKDFGITRERVRQIQNATISKIKPKLEKHKKIFQSFLRYFEKFGGLRKEEKVLTELGEEKWRNEVFFLLSLEKPFQRFKENNEFYSFWFIDQNALIKAKEIINSLFQKFQKTREPLSQKEILNIFPLKEKILDSYLEISKKIQKNPEGLFGLKEWPEINPRSIKDKAYLILKKTGKPLHFFEVAKMIEGALVQTVHNELIRDSRFVLVGRGIYALKEWGYYPGDVKDVISKILKEEGPLTKDEILKRVLKQRIIKKSTVLVNLNNKKYFLKDSQDKYTIREI